MFSVEKEIYHQYYEISVPTHERINVSEKKLLLRKLLELKMCDAIKSLQRNTMRAMWHSTPTEWS
jgi:hypothetical protein